MPSSMLIYPLPGSMTNRLPFGSRSVSSLQFVRAYISMYFRTCEVTGYRPAMKNALLSITMVPRQIGCGSDVYVHVNPPFSAKDTQYKQQAQQKGLVKNMLVQRAPVRCTSKTRGLGNRPVGLTESDSWSFRCGLARCAGYYFYSRVDKSKVAYVEMKANGDDKFGDPDKEVDREEMLPLTSPHSEVNGKSTHTATFSHGESVIPPFLQYVGVTYKVRRLCGVHKLDGLSRQM